MRKVVIITQNEPLYIYENMERLLLEVSPDVKFVHCIILPSREFGKKLNKLSLIRKTLESFGFKFIRQYILRRIYRKLIGKDDIIKLLRKYKVRYTVLNDDINSKENIDFIKSLDCDIGISILGSQIFKEQLIETLPLLLNLHSSLLPSNRGMLPSFWSMLNSDPHVGVSLFQVDCGIDSGPIAIQRKIENRFKSQSDFIRATKNLGMSMVIEALNCDELTFKQQNDSLATYNKMPTRVQVNKFYDKGYTFF